MYLKYFSVKKVLVDKWKKKTKNKGDISDISTSTLVVQKWSTEKNSQNGAPVSSSIWVFLQCI